MIPQYLDADDEVQDLMGEGVARVVPGGHEVPTAPGDDTSPPVPHLRQAPVALVRGQLLAALHGTESERNHDDHMQQFLRIVVEYL